MICTIVTLLNCTLCFLNISIVCILQLTKFPYCSIALFEQKRQSYLDTFRAAEDAKVSFNVV